LSGRDRRGYHAEKERVGPPVDARFSPAVSGISAPRRRDRPHSPFFEEATVSSVCKRSLAVLLLALAVAAVAAPPAPPSKEQIARWVEQLGDNDFAVREAASKALWEAGRAAETALMQAARSDDAEVSQRARAILEKFKWGVYPDTPKKIVNLIAKYQAADNANKGAVLRELLEEGADGCKALTKIATAEQDANVRRELNALIHNQLVRAVPQLLLEDNFDVLEALLEIEMASDARLGAGHYAAFYLLRGKLDERVAHFKALATRDPNNKRYPEALAYLYRAQGDLNAAVEAAEKAEQPDLAERLLSEAGNWKELARRGAAVEVRHPVEQLGYRTTYHRLAGNARELEDALAEVRRYADAEVQGARDIRLLHAAKIFFLNDRPADALEALSKGGHKTKVFEILIAQLKFDEAIQLVERVRKEKVNEPAEQVNELPALEILLARTLYSLGEREKALPIFEKYAGQIKEGNDFSWFETLIDAESRVGLKEQALEHCGKILTVSRDQGWPVRLFAKVFPGKGDSARVWWSYLRHRHPDEAAPVLLRRVRELVEGKAKPETVREAVQGALEAVGAFKADEDMWLLALAETAVDAGLEPLAQTCLEKGSTPGPLVRLGDLLAKKKDWERAAERYRQAWEKDRAQPLALYLRGWALTQAGKEAEGKKLIEQSHWLPLGDEYVRSAFLRALAQRGHKEASRRETDLLLKLSEPRSFQAGEAMRVRAADAYARKDLLESARGHEQALLRCLQTTTGFVQPSAYVGVPALVHRQRASGLLAAGRLAEAKQEIARCQMDLPANVTLANFLVPELEKAGLKKEADELFDQTLAAYEKLCKEYPRCPWTHNESAWLSVCCRRNLDGALAHSLKAVELAPENAGHLDTLAEVYFQRGDKEKALATQQKVVALDSKKAYYQKQLRRIQAGDPLAERPSQEDD
jgi:tetratricopeptide (TPR) repeat protein